MGLKNFRSPKRNKKTRYAITNVSQKDISKIIKEFENLPYEGYVQKRSKHEPTDSYFYLEIQLANFMTRLNSYVDPVRTQMNNTQNMNKYDTSTQKTPDFRVFYSDESE